MTMLANPVQSVQDVLGQPDIASEYFFALFKTLTSRSPLCYINNRLTLLINTDLSRVETFDVHKLEQEEGLLIISVGTPDEKAQRKQALKDIRKAGFSVHIKYGRMIYTKERTDTTDHWALASFRPEYWIVTNHNNGRSMVIQQWVSLSQYHKYPVFEYIHCFALNLCGQLNVREAAEETRMLFGSRCTYGVLQAKSQAVILSYLRSILNNPFASTGLSFEGMTLSEMIRTCLSDDSIHQIANEYKERNSQTANQDPAHLNTDDPTDKKIMDLFQEICHRFSISTGHQPKPVDNISHINGQNGFLPEEAVSDCPDEPDTALEVTVDTAPNQFVSVAPGEPVPIKIDESAAARPVVQKVIDQVVNWSTTVIEKIREFFHTDSQSSEAEATPTNDQSPDASPGLQILLFTDHLAPPVQDATNVPTGSSTASDTTHPSSQTVQENKMRSKRRSKNGDTDEWDDRNQMPKVPEKTLLIYLSEEEIEEKRKLAMIFYKTLILDDS